MKKHTYRSAALTEKYRQHRESDLFKSGCVLCAAPALKTFTYWKIIPNDFPYDLIAGRHDLIIPLRHVTEEELTAEELAEYRHIKLHEFGEYQYIIESTLHTKSIPAHHHLHLIVCRTDLE